MKQLFKSVYCKNDVLLRLSYNKLQSHKRHKDKKFDDLKLKLERLKLHAEAQHKMLKHRSLYDFRVRFHINLTYRKCRKLYKALELSDKKITQTYRLYYRLLTVFRLQNRMAKKIVWQLTKNTRIDPQISFWRLRDMGNKIQAMSAIKVVKIKKMGEILFKAYIIKISRAFTKIDKMGYDLSINSSMIMDQKN